MESFIRTEKIMELLLERKYISAKELCKILYASTSTVRRDIMELEKSGAVKRYRGGIILNSRANNELSYLYRAEENKAAKQYICGLAADFLQDGCSLFLDSSTTVNNICPIICERGPITVVTNGLKTALDLNAWDNINVFITGGQLKNNSGSVIGESAGRFIDDFRADYAMISCAGMDKDGIYESDQMQAAMKQHFIKNSDFVILLCDSQKINKRHFFKMAGFSDINAVISEEKPPQQIEKAIAAAGCKVYY